MKKLINLIISVFLSASILADNPFKGTHAIVAAEFIYRLQDVPFPSCHASTIVETNDGFLAAWFGGTEEKNPDVCIYASTFVNKAWIKPVKIADGIQDGMRFPCWNPVLFRKDNGDIVLYYKVGPDPRRWWGLFKISTDNGRTWSPATRIPDNLLGPIKNKPVRLPDGKIIYPTSFETSEKWNIYMEISDQNLNNWQKITINNNHYNCIQPTILNYKDGTLQLLCRSRNNNINESWSKDKGLTWSAVLPTQLPNNNSGIDAVTLSNGKQLLIFNPIIKGRNKLALAVSDDGKKWEAAVLLENDSNQEAEYSYPAIIQSKDGLIHITYTWNRKLIKHLIIDPSILKTKPIIEGNWPED